MNMNAPRTFLMVGLLATAAGLAGACGDPDDGRGPACNQLLACCDQLVQTSTVLTCGLQPLSFLEEFQCEIDLRLIGNLSQGTSLPEECTPTGTSTVPETM